MDEDRIVKLLTEIRDLQEKTLATLAERHAKLDKQRDETREWALGRGIVPMFALMVILILVALFRR